MKPAHELRILFTPADGGAFTVHFETSPGQRVGVPVSFTPFLQDAGYEDLRWYLEEFMECPDGGAMVRAEGVERRLKVWGRRLHDEIFSVPENTALLAALLTAPEPRELTIATDDSVILRIPWELIEDSAGNLAHRVSIRRQLATPEAATPRAIALPLRILYIISRPGDTGFIDPRLTTREVIAALDPIHEHVRLDFCRPPTLARMEEMLRDAKVAGDPYDLVRADRFGNLLATQVPFRTGSFSV